MPSQNDFRIMQILQPLCRITRQPSEDAMAVYCEKLAKFPHDTLKEAVNRILETWDRTTFPPLAIFMRECGVCGINFISGNKVSEDRLPWNECKGKREELITSWRNNFLQSEIYNIARREGWCSRLYRYANAVADIQAQIIYLTGNADIGWSHYAIEGSREIKQVIEAQRGLASSGHITVEIPNDLIEAWKAWTVLENETDSMQTTGMARKYGASLSKVVNEVTHEITA